LCDTYSGRYHRIRPFASRDRPVIPVAFLTIHLRTLGQIDLRDAAGNELRALLTQPKRLAVLVYLASTASQRLCRRDTLMAMFWPEADTERARAALRQALHFIRQEVGEEIFVTRAADEIGVQPGAVEVDANQLADLADAGDHAAALALYGGDFLDRFFIRGAPDFERWVAQERDRLRKRAAESAWSLVEARVAAGDMRGAREFAQRAVQLSPDSEIAVRRFIELLARSGDNVAALSAYRELESYLAEEFGVKPSQETLTLVRSLSEPRRFTPVGVLRIEPASEQPDERAQPQPTPVLVPEKRVRSPLVLIALGLVLLISIGGAILQRSRGTARPAMDADRIAVLPFLVRGGTELRYLHDGLPMLLSTRLDGALRLRTVDMRAILLEQARRSGDSISLDAAAEVAEGFGAGLYVVGSVVGSSKALHIEAALHDSRNPDTPVARAQVDGPETALVSLVERLSAALLADRFRERGGLAAEMAARTSPSFAALKAWLEGESAMAAGQYAPAIASFRRAIAADSTFAMAYYRLAVAASWAGEYTAIEPAIVRAQELSEQLPPSARSFVQAFSAYRRGRYAEAERIDRAILAERPTNIDVQFDLAELLYHGNPPRGRSITEARDAFEQVLRQDPRSFPAMSHLARLAAARGDTKALDSLTRNALAGNPDGTHRGELLLLRAVTLNDEDAAQRFAAIPPDLTQIDALWRAAEYTGGLARMQSLTESLLSRVEHGELRTSLLVFLAHVALGREQIAVAERYTDSLSVRAPQYAAVTMSLIARHPAAGAQRARLNARARTMLDRAEQSDPKRSSRIYLGSPHLDNGQPHIGVERALLALATGDSVLARRLVKDTNSQSVNATSRVRVQLALAGTDASRDSALRAVAALDSSFGNKYAQQLLLAPRALLNLSIADLLAKRGQREAALKRLETVPEDFGFNVAYLAEIHRRKASLLRAMGRSADAVAEDALAGWIVR
jgi:DNA-binding SARP family transcriptional activator/tetratricopeptide (TPR) repeat protein